MTMTTNIEKIKKIKTNDQVSENLVKYAELLMDTYLHYMNE